MLVQTASQYESKIYLETDGKRVNAKSIMGMMTLGLAAGGMIKVEADGTDEEQAVAQIGFLFHGITACSSPSPKRFITHIHATTMTIITRAMAEPRWGL